ncbi:hypothetical protein UR09_01655 [Candidatus Nitromaritima sp. SCGC AAA799-A02]|nr:hypothetical protein UR09_01655 [Candidatus Nitromaritima sp. SCGC AAA799-A02]
MANEITEIVIPILNTLQKDMRGVKDDISGLKGDVAVLKENTARIDRRLQTVESHMTGFMNSARNLEMSYSQMWCMGA